MYCRYCGRALGEQARFCPECGKPTGQDSARSVQKTVQAPEKRNRKAARTAAVVLGLLVLFGAAAVLAVHLLGRFGPGDSQTGGDRTDREADEPIYLLEEEIRYNADGSVFSRTAYEYDKDGRMTRQMEYHGSTLSNTITYTYERTPEGLLRLGSYSQSQGTARREELLDEAGRTVHSRYFNADGSCYSESRMEYDSQGRALRGEQIREDGGISSGVFQDYDELGNLLTFQIYSGSRDQVYDSIEYIYTYGEDGYPRSAEIIWNGKTNRAEYRYTYFPNGQPEQVEMITDNGEERRITYDKNGNLLTMEYYSEDGELSQQVENTYDKAGNLLSQKMYSGDQFQSWYEYSYTKLK